MTPPAALVTGAGLAIGRAAALARAAEGLKVGALARDRDVCAKPSSFMRTFRTSTRCGSDRTARCGVWRSMQPTLDANTSTGKRRSRETRRSPEGRSPIKNRHHGRARTVRT